MALLQGEPVSPRQSESAEDALRADPEHVDAWLVMGMANFRLRMLGEAEMWLRKVVAARPDIVDAHSILGMALAIQGAAGRGDWPISIGGDSQTRPRKCT